MKSLTLRSLLRSIQVELTSLKAVNVEDIDKGLLDRKIKKSKAIAYLVSIALQVLEKSEIQGEIEELRKEMESLQSKMQ